MNKINVNMLVGECWYAMDVSRGVCMPIDKTSSGEINLINGVLKNQSAPFLVSNHGRYIWSVDSFNCRYSRGKLVCYNEPSKHSVDLYEGFGTLRDAYLDASKRFFAFEGKYPNENLFRMPLYCTYAYLGEDVSAEAILEYAESIIDNGMLPGVLTIDYGWQKIMGDFEFDLTKFPQPKMIIDKLHDMGFKVRLWICPFVNRESKHFRYLKYGDMLVKTSRNDLAIRKWSHGKDPVLDLSNPDAVLWLRTECNALMRDYGVDGFKFEGAEANFYKDSDITYNAVDATAQSMLWGNIAENYDYNETRAVFKCGGLPITVRLYNKSYQFEGNGLKTIVPDMLMQGILGYPYGCPDMVGGTTINRHAEKKHKLGVDMELMIRYAEACALMPIVQYSLPIWKMDNNYVSSLFIKAYELHEKYANYIMSLVKNASKTGEPIVRYLEYEFPHQGFSKVNNMFMLGSKYLVAPILSPNQYKLKIRLPKGLWRYVDSKIYEGEVTVDAPLEILPVFEKMQ